MSQLAMPLTLDRRVQLWSYQVSHSVLLLRANISPAETSRVDLMFRAVKELHIKNRYEGLAIDVLRSDAAAAEFSLNASDLKGRFVFSLTPTVGRKGYIVAGSLFLSEDDLSDGDPSSIDHAELERHVIRAGAYK